MNNTRSPENFLFAIFLAGLAIMCCGCSGPDTEPQGHADSAALDEASWWQEVNLVDLLGRHPNDTELLEVFRVMGFRPTSITSAFTIYESVEMTFLRTSRFYINYESECKQVLIKVQVSALFLQTPHMWVHGITVRNPERNSLLWKSVARSFSLAQPVGTGPILAEVFFEKTEDRTTRVAYESPPAPASMRWISTTVLGGRVSHMYAEFDSGVTSSLTVNTGPFFGLAIQPPVRAQHAVLPMSMRASTIQTAVHPHVPVKPGIDSYDLILANADPAHQALLAAKDVLGIETQRRQHAVIQVNDESHSVMPIGNAQSLFDLLGTPLNDPAAIEAMQAHEITVRRLTSVHSIDQEGRLVRDGGQYSLELRSANYRVELRAGAGGVAGESSAPATIQSVHIRMADQADQGEHGGAEWAAVCAAMGWPPETTTFQQGMQLLLDEAGEKGHEVHFNGWSMDPRTLRRIAVPESRHGTDEKLIWNFFILSGVIEGVRLEMRQ